MNIINRIVALLTAAGFKPVVESRILETLVIVGDCHRICVHVNHLDGGPYLSRFVAGYKEFPSRGSFAGPEQQTFLHGNWYAVMHNADDAASNIVEDFNEYLAEEQERILKEEEERFNAMRDAEYACGG